MAINIPRFDLNASLKTFMFALVFLFFISQIINFAAIGQDDANIFREDVDYGQIAPQTFAWLIVVMSTWLAWQVVGRTTEGRFDKKYLLTIVVAGILLYFLYAKILQPVLAANGVNWLPNLNFAAYQLQSILIP
jgi:hypothetical protein